MGETTNLEVNWQTVADAVEQVKSGDVKKVENDNWKVYRVVNVVRIDVKVVV